MLGALARLAPVGGGRSAGGALAGGGGRVVGDFVAGEEGVGVGGGGVEAGVGVGGGGGVLVGDEVPEVGLAGGVVPTDLRIMTPA